MNVYIHEKADKELKGFSVDAQKQFSKIIIALNRDERLDLSKFKKLKNYNLFEIRIKENGQIYRALGSIISKNYLILLFFKKKTQKTPKKEIDTALRRLNFYLSNYG